MMLCSLDIYICLCICVGCVQGRSEIRTIGHHLTVDNWHVCPSDLDSFMLRLHSISVHVISGWSFNRLQYTSSSRLVSYYVLEYTTFSGRRKIYRKIYNIREVFVGGNANNFHNIPQQAATVRLVLLRHYKLNVSWCDLVVLG